MKTEALSSLIKVAVDARLLAGIIGSLSGGAIGAISNKKSRLKGALLGALLGGVAGAGAGHAYNARKPKSDLLADDDYLEKQVLKDLRFLHSYATNFAYRNKRMPNSIDEMLPGYGIGQDGNILSQRIWDARRGGDRAAEYRLREEGSPNYNKYYSTKYRFAVVPSEKGNDDRHALKYALLAYPENGGENTKAYVARLGPVDLSNTFSFSRTPDIRIMPGSRVEAINSITPEIDKELDALDASGLYFN